MLINNSIPDTTLINAVCHGDTNSYAVLISRYEKKIKALGMSFFKNQTDTEDFLQDVFLKAYKNIQSFKGNSLFSTWLMRIAYNTAINSIKRRKEYLPLSEDFDIQDTNFNPEEQQIRAAVKKAVYETMKDIPERFAVCLDMYFFYDMAYSEISEVMNLPVNTVKSHIFRAKKLMKEKLEEIL